jgi:hypothetical protein
MNREAELQAWADEAARYLLRLDRERINRDAAIAAAGSDDARLNHLQYQQREYVALDVESD